MIRLCHTGGPHIFYAKREVAERIYGDIGDALHPAACVTKDYLLAAQNKFFCHILDAH